MGVVAGPGGLTHLRFEPNHEDVPDGDGAPSAREILEAAQRQLNEYFAGRRQTFDVPLDLRGTAFQLAVWNALLQVPFGETVSYATIAERIDRPSAVRAVGAANGANPIPIIVPCHRVVGRNGTLTGYRGGLPIKKRLLDLEGVSQWSRPPLDPTS